MIGVGAFTVFALGMRHGADPDHLAAIDNLTRNSAQRRPMLSRFVGTLFAGGHSVMVLTIALLVGYVGSHVAGKRALIESIGTWISIFVLLVLAAMNLRQLISGQSDGLIGLKTRLLPPALRKASSPLVAVVVGLLFGFGFETSSQVAAYALAFSVDAGVFGALLIGLMFCFGMTVTDTLDSLLVHRLVSDRSSRLPKTMRVWIWSVTVMALAVAAYELAQMIGWRSPVPDIAVSAMLVAALIVVFGYVILHTKRVAARVGLTAPLAQNVR